MNDKWLEAKHPKFLSSFQANNSLVNYPPERLRSCLVSSIELKKLKCFYIFGNHPNDPRVPSTLFIQPCASLKDMALARFEPATSQMWDKLASAKPFSHLILLHLVTWLCFDFHYHGIAIYCFVIECVEEYLQTIFCIRRQIYQNIQRWRCWNWKFDWIRNTR